MRKHYIVWHINMKHNLYDAYENYKVEIMHFETVIGLEVHVELKQTQNVLSIAFGAEPNSNTNVIDLAYPGVLPVVNRRAVDWAMRASMALNMDIATNSKFDRKTIFIQIIRKHIKFLNLINQSVKMDILILKLMVKRNVLVLLVFIWKKT